MVGARHSSSNGLENLISAIRLSGYALGLVGDLSQSPVELYCK